MSKMKLLLIGGAFVLVAGAVAAAGLVYVAYRVTSRVEKTAREMSGRPSGTATVRAEAARRIDACALLSAEEASQILGVAIERAQAQAGAGPATCLYYTRPKSKEERTASLADTFLSMAKNPDDRPLPPGKDNPVEVARRTGAADLAKQVGSLTGAADAPYLAVTVDADGRAGFSVLKGTIAANSAGMSTTEGLAGIGDESFLGPMDTFLAFVKGPVSVQIDLSHVPRARDKGVSLARKIAGRL